VTDHERLHRDRKAYDDAQRHLRSARERVAAAGGDPTWGPALGAFALAMIALERRLDEAAKAAEVIAP
jgi:hypothetical protein